MRRILKYVFLFSLLLFIVGAGGLAYTYVKHPDIQFGSLTAQRFDEQKDFPAAGITALEVDTDTSDISVIPSLDESIRVNLSGQISEKQKQALTYTTSQSKDGILRVTVKRGVVFGFPFQFDGRLELVISVPAKEFDRIELATSTGDVRIKKAQAKLMQLETSTGDTIVQDSVTQELTIQSSTGDIKLADTAGKMKLANDTGDITATFTKKLEHDLEIDSSTGDIAIQLGGLPDALRAELESSTGDVKVRITGLQTDQQQEQEHSFQGAYGTDGPLIHAQTSTGDIELTQKNEQGL